MGIRHRAKLLVKTSLLLVILLGVLAASGCAGIGTIPRGWSGGVIADDTLFIGSMEGKLVALDTSDGSRLWEALLGSPESTGGGFGCAPATASVAIYGTPTVDGDLVYVGGYISQDTNGIIYAFDRDEPRGEPRWVYPRQGTLGGHIVGGLIVAQGKVYFGSSDGRIYALDAAEGYKEWVFETGDKLWATPAIAGDTLFIGSFSKKLYALDVADGSKKWEFETEGAIVSTPVVYNNTVYFGSFDRHLYAVDITNGKQNWKFPAGDEGEQKPEKWFWAKPVVHNGVVYAAGLDGKVYALNAESGDNLVEFDLGSPVSSSPVLVDDLLVVATEDGVVYTLDTDSNQQKRLASLEEKVYASLAASQGIIYIHTAQGTVYGIDVRSGARQEFNVKS